VSEHEHETAQHELQGEIAAVNEKRGKSVCDGHTLLVRQLQQSD
jgi:hypothetical protein